MTDTAGEGVGSHPDDPNETEVIATGSQCPIFSVHGLAYTRDVFTNKMKPRACMAPPFNSA